MCQAFPQDKVLAGTYLRPAADARKWDGIEAKILLDNRHERFHVLPSEPPRVPDTLIIDFKILVACAPDYLQRWIRYRPESRPAVLLPPFRDRLTQRFANYFTRIAEPED